MLLLVQAEIINNKKLLRQNNIQCKKTCHINKMNRLKTFLWIGKNIYIYACFCNKRLTLKHFKTCNV